MEGGQGHIFMHRICRPRFTLPRRAAVPQMDCEVTRSEVERFVATCRSFLRKLGRKRDDLSLSASMKRKLELNQNGVDVEHDSEEAARIFFRAQRGGFVKGAPRCAPRDLVT